MRAADLDLRAAKASLFRAQGILDQRGGVDVEPAAFGGVKRDAGLRAAGHAVQRLLCAVAFQIPKGGINRGQCQRGDCADRGRMGQKQQVAPDAFNLGRLAPDQRGDQGVLQKRHDRRPAGADGIAVAGAHHAIRVGDPHDGGFLTDKALDRVGALHLRHQIDHQGLYKRDLRHVFSYAARWWIRPMIARETAS